MDEVNKEDNSWLGIMVFFGLLGLVFGLLAVAHSYGVLEIREDLSEAQYLRAVGAVCGIFGCMLADEGLKKIKGLSDGVRKVLRAVTLVMMLMMAFFLLCGCADEDKWDFFSLAFTFLLWLALLLIILYMMYIYKHGEFGTRLDAWMNEKLGIVGEKADDLNAKYREREERSAKGLINSGYNDRTYTKTTLHVHVRSYSIAFTVAVLTIALCACVAHLTDYKSDERAVACVIAFFIGYFCYHLFVYSEINGAVCKGGLPYNEGARYFLVTLAGLTTLFWVGIQVETVESFDYSIEDWLFYIVAWFTIYASFFLITVVGNKADGRIFSMFDVDGYRKKMTEKED